MAYPARSPKAKGSPKSEPQPQPQPQAKPFTCANEKGRIGDTDEWRPGKRMNITAQDTGRIQNKTIVSVESPDWMKSFFENNRAYFEKTGKAQTLKKATVGDCAAGVASSARARGKKTGLNMTCDETGVPLSQLLGSQNSPDWMNTARKWTSPQTPRRNGERAGKDRFTTDLQDMTSKEKSASDMQHLLVSEKVPEWMRTAAVVEKMAKGHLKSREDSRAAGVKTERFWDDSARSKGGNMLHPVTGTVVHKAQQSLEFPLDSGRAHRDAYEDAMRQRPNSARAHSGTYAGGGKPKETHKKKGTVVDQDTGKVANNSIVSSECPQWMKAPFESNREHFENEGVAQKLKNQTPEELQQKEFIAGRKIPVRPRQAYKQVTNEAGRVQNLSIVSRGAPEWMKSPFESNRDFFEGLGLAQGQQPRRSRSAPPAAVLSAEGTEKAKGIPCHAEQRSARKSSDASVVSATSRRSSSAMSYSARHQARSVSSATGKADV